jgi:hypothetical protein
MSLRLRFFFLIGNGCSRYHYEINVIYGGKMNRFLILLGLYMVVGTAISIAVFRAKQTEEEYFVGAGMEEAPVLSRAVSQLSH